MTKAELIKFLEPFDDEIQIMVVDEYEYQHFPIKKPIYTIDSFSGKGYILLHW